jgi:hypothetical protein
MRNQLLPLLNVQCCLSIRDHVAFFLSGFKSITASFTLSSSSSVDTGHVRQRTSAELESAGARERPDARTCLRKRTAFSCAQALDRPTNDKQRRQLIIDTRHQQTVILCLRRDSNSRPARPRRLIDTVTVAGAGARVSARRVLRSAAASPPTAHVLEGGHHHYHYHHPHHHIIGVVFCFVFCIVVVCLLFYLFISVCGS